MIRPAEETAVIEYAVWCGQENRALEGMVEAGAGPSDVIEYSLAVFRKQMPPEILQGFHDANIALLERIKAARGGAGEELARDLLNRQSEALDEFRQEIAKLPSWVTLHLVAGGCTE